MLVVITAVDPSGQDHHRLVDAQIVVEMLRDLRDFVQRVADICLHLARTVVAGRRHGAVEDKRLEIRRARHLADGGARFRFLHLPRLHKSQIHRDFAIRPRDSHIRLPAQRTDETFRRPRIKPHRHRLHNRARHIFRISPARRKRISRMRMRPIDEQRATVLFLPHHRHRRIPTVGRPPVPRDGPQRPLRIKAFACTVADHRRAIVIVRDWE